MKKYVTKEDYRRVLSQMVVQSFVACKDIRIEPFVIMFVDDRGKVICCLDNEDAKVVLSSIDKYADCGQTYRDLYCKLVAFVRQEEGRKLVL